MPIAPPHADARRRLLALAACASLLPRALAAPAGAPGMQFPRDFGSHPASGIEWWYITGHVAATGGGSEARAFGFQLTFFRSRVAATQGLRSAFAAKQLLFAHAALTDLQGGRLLHDQRIARAGMGVAFASQDDTVVRLRDWSLAREEGHYLARLPAEGFSLDLRFETTQPVLLQGEAGLSRKGPLPEQSSHYYSEPQLAASGQISLNGSRHTVSGRAWLDHEWSDTLMPPEAVGWDWIGMNLHDGGALTAFRLRDRQGGTVWAGGSFRPAGGAPQVFAHDAVRFTPGRNWQSPASQARYPVEWTVQTPAGRFAVRALLDNQELDSRGSTGAIYWEGVSELLDAQGRVLGRGYLEMTGYAQPLRL